MDLDEKLAKKQNTLNTVTVYCNFVQKASSYLAQLPQLPSVKAKRLVTAVLDKCNTITVPHGYRVLNKTLINECQGLLDGLEASVKSSKLQITAFPEAHQQLVSHIKQIKADMKAIENGAEFDSDMDRETIRILKQTSSQITRLQKIKNKKWMAVRASVVPIPDQAYINIAKLQGAFDVDNLNGYVCMHRQLCLGINKKYLAKTGLRLNEYLEELVDYLSKQKGEKLIVLNSKGMMSNITGMNVNWYWLMTQHQADNFRRAFLSTQQSKTARYINGIAIRDWGFANAS